MESPGCAQVCWIAASEGNGLVRRILDCAAALEAQGRIQNWTLRGSKLDLRWSRWSRLEKELVASIETFRPDIAVFLCSDALLDDAAWKHVLRILARNAHTRILAVNLTVTELPPELAAFPRLPRNGLPIMAQSDVGQAMIDVVHGLVEAPTVRAADTVGSRAAASGAQLDPTSELSPHVSRMAGSMPLIARGERAANVRFKHRDDFVAAAGGSFFLAQYLCHIAAARAGVIGRQRKLVEIKLTASEAVAAIQSELEARFRAPMIDLAAFDAAPPPRGAALSLLWLLALGDGFVAVRDAQQRFPMLRAAFDWLLAGNLARYLHGAWEPDARWRQGRARIRCLAT